MTSHHFSRKSGKNTCFLLTLTHEIHHAHNIELRVNLSYVFNIVPYEI